MLRQLDRSDGRWIIIEEAHKIKKTLQYVE